MSWGQSGSAFEHLPEVLDAVARELTHERPSIRAPGGPQRMAPLGELDPETKRFMPHVRWVG